MERRDNSVHPELRQDEIDVLDLLTAGFGKREIANRLHIEMRTVERRLDQIADKFTKIDGRLSRVKGQANRGEEIGYLGRIATILMIYREYYLKDRSESITDAYPVFHVRRRDVRFETDITKEEILIGAQIGIQSLRERLSYVAHGLILDDRSPQADASYLDLEASTMAQGVSVTDEIVNNDPKTPRFLVHFNPPLKLGEQLSYHYSIRSANYLPMSIQEIQERIAKGYYHLKEEVAESTYTISTPTDHLFLQLTFPPFFSIENEHVNVEVSYDGPQSQEEEQRIRSTSALTKSLFGRRIRLTLDLKQPLLNHRYRIRWRPCEP